jgi:erythrin-vacuolar iron transport family protein
MERAAARFYRHALRRATDASVRRLLGDLAEAEDKHDQLATGLEHQVLTDSVLRDEAENERRRFVLQVIEPGLVGLMDGLYRRSRRCSPRRSRPQFVERVCGWARGGT